MAKVKISVTGTTKEYFLTLFNDGGYKFKGKKNEDIDKELSAGTYTLKYNVIGNPGSKFKVNFKGTKSPKNSLNRVIPQKGYTSRTKEIIV